MERNFEIKVLDHGFVRYVDHMGSDESIVAAARMSTGRGFVSWDPYRRCKGCQQVSGIKDNPLLCEDHGGFEKFPRGDFGILEFMYKMGHTSPFEMCELIVDIQIPMDAWRQMIRHRMASVNEYSTRYTEAIDVCAKTDPAEWRTQGVTNRQGSGGFLPVGKEALAPIAGHGGAYLSQRETELQDFAREVYEERIEAGVAKEQARKDLPLSNYTLARWKLDLHNLLHIFLAKRMHAHAQLEIRLFANAIAEIAKTHWPRSYAFFEEYTQHAVTFSRSEVEALKKLTDVNLVMEGVNFEARKSLAAKLGLIVR